MRIEVEQNTPEWDALRLGKFTASGFRDLFAGKSTATYKKAIKKVAYERLTGETPESFHSEYMERGHELEPEAIDKYTISRFPPIEVQSGAFYELNEWVGCSPDGVVDDGLIEIKCPSYGVMMDYLVEQTLPKEYFYQVHGQMWVTGALWCDFVAYHPKLPFFVLRVYRDEEAINLIEKEVNMAIKKAKDLILKLKKL